jgi:hypothetical protein
MISPNTGAKHVARLDRDVLSKLFMEWGLGSEEEWESMTKKHMISIVFEDRLVCAWDAFDGSVEGWIDGRAICTRGFAV